MAARVKKTTSAARKTATASADSAEAGERRKGQTVRLSVAAWKQLKFLAIEQEKPAHELLVEAVNLLFHKYGKRTVA
jgi:hypothetical protein